MTNTQSPAPGARRVVEKSNCVIVHEGNFVIGSFTGPDAKRNADAFAGLQASAAAVGSITDAELDEAVIEFNQHSDRLPTKDKLRAVFQGFLASRTHAPGMAGGVGASLLRRATVQIERWSEKYGEFQPEWLPPAGDVRLLEDIEEFLESASVAGASSKCPICGLDTPHAHHVGEVVAWLRAQASRFIPNLDEQVIVHQGNLTKLMKEVYAARMQKEWDGRDTSELWRVFVASTDPALAAPHPSPAPQAAGAGPISPEEWAEFKEWLNRKRAAIEAGRDAS